MKKILYGIGITIISLIITFFTFEQLSWYHFGDIPTKIVLLRIIIVFIAIVALITGVALIVKKIRK